MFFSFPHIAIDATGEVGSIGCTPLQHALSNLLCFYFWWLCDGRALLLTECCVLSDASATAFDQIQEPCICYTSAHPGYALSTSETRGTATVVQAPGPSGSQQGMWCPGRRAGRHQGQWSGPQLLDSRR